MVTSPFDTTQRAVGLVLAWRTSCMGEAPSSGSAHCPEEEAAGQETLRARSPSNPGREPRERLHVVRLREHIEASDGFEPKAARDEDLEIPRERHRIAG